MGRNGFDDTGMDEWVDDAVDDRLRYEFARTLSGGLQPDQVLRDLAPEFGRARRRRQTKQTLLGVAASVMFLGGVGFALNAVELPTTDSATVAGQPDEVELTDDEHDLLEVNGTTTIPRPPESASMAVDSEVTSEDTNESQPDTSLEETETTEVPSTTTGDPATTGSTTVSPTTTVPRTTTAVQVTTTDGAPSTTLLETECGSVGVSVSRSTVTVVEILPKDGYRADNKSSGPDSIEVSFEGGREHCELKAKMRGGRLVIEHEDDDDE